MTHIRTGTLSRVCSFSNHERGWKKRTHKDTGRWEFRCFRNITGALW